MKLFKFPPFTLLVFILAFLMYSSYAHAGNTISNDFDSNYTLNGVTGVNLDCHVADSCEFTTVNQNQEYHTHNNNSYTTNQSVDFGNNKTVNETNVYQNYDADEVRKSIIQKLGVNSLQFAPEGWSVAIDYTDDFTNDYTVVGGIGYENDSLRFNLSGGDDFVSAGLTIKLGN